jgi:hypothetical protein
MVKETLRSLSAHSRRQAFRRDVGKVTSAVGGAVANGEGVPANAVGNAGSMVANAAHAVANGVGLVAHGVGHVAGAVKNAVKSYAPAPAPAPRGRSTTTRARKAPVVPAPPAPAPAPPAPAPAPAPMLPDEAAHRARATELGIDHSKMVFTKNGEPHRSRTANNAYWAGIEPAPSPAAAPMGLRSRRRAVS